VAYRSPLVDRAWILRKEAAEPGETVEGTVIFNEPDPDTPADVPEAKQFRCRLDLGDAAERSKDGMTQVDPKPLLMCDRVTKDRTPVELRIGDQVKVVSKELGTAVWEVDGRAKPVRKKRRVIGWEVTVHRTEES